MILDYTLAIASPLSFGHMRRRPPILHALRKEVGAMLDDLFASQGRDLKGIPKCSAAHLRVGCRAAGKQQRKGARN